MKKEQQEESTAKKNRKKKKKRQNKRVGRKVAVTVSGEAEKVTGSAVAHRPGPCGGALSIVRRGGPYYYCRQFHGPQ